MIHKASLNQRTYTMEREWNAMPWRTERIP